MGKKNMNTTYQHVSLSKIPRSRSNTKRARPEHPNTAYRPSLIHEVSPSRPSKAEGTTNTPNRGASHSMTTTVKKQHTTTQKITDNKNTRDMAKTSLQAFQQKKRNGTLQTDKQKVLYLIKEYGPVTSLELQMWMNKPKHKFTGRITQLQDEGKIHATGEKNGHEQYEVKQ